MSQSSRLHASRPSRLREKLARELARFVQLHTLTTQARASGETAVDAVLDGAWPDDHTGPCFFDVHAARERALALVLYGRHAHPELPSTLDTVPALDGHDLAYTRLGQQLLDMLDAKPGSMWGHARYQSGACRGTQGIGRCDSMFDALTCSACQGTGHNLRGVLPAVEVTTQMRRRVADWLDVDGTNESDWLSDFDDGTAVSITTRVVARGEHREHGSWSELVQSYRTAPKGTEARREALDALISAKTWGRADLTHVPRWLLGEWKHAEQRRAKAARATAEFTIGDEP